MTPTRRRWRWPTTAEGRGGADSHRAPRRGRARLSPVHRRADTGGRCGLTPRTTRVARQAGAATAELVVATPLLMLLILLVVQFALYLHALHVTQAAAAQALAAARAENGSVAAGQAQAKLALDQLAGDLLTDTSVSVTRSSAEASVEVSGTAQQVVPFLELPVGSIAHGPVEVFTQDGP